MNLKERKVYIMKITKLFLALFFLTASVIYAQPMMPPPPMHGNLGELLNLSTSQKENVEKIIKDSKLKIEKLNKQERASLKKYRESIKNILDASNVKILKLLDKTQTAKFKEFTDNMKEREMMPPPPAGNLPQGRPETAPRQMQQKPGWNKPPDPGFRPGECMRRTPSRIDNCDMMPDMPVLEMLLENDNSFIPDSLNGR